MNSTNSTMKIMPRINKINLQILSALFLLIFIPNVAQAADLVFSPTTGSIVAGKSFTVNVNLSNNSQTINAVSGTISFPSDLLTVTGVSKAGSIVSMWVSEPSYSQGGGTVNFEGIIFNPGFSGSTGKIISITFTPKKTGKANLLFSSGAILANDGQATNILSKLGSASFVSDSGSVSSGNVATTHAPVENPLVPEAPKIESSTNPDSGKWYNNNSPVFSWDVPEGVTALRASYGIGQTTVPTREYVPVISGRTLSKINDGIYYLHVQYKNAHGLGPVAHYKFSIDTRPPQPFEIKFPEGDQSDNPRPVIDFRTTDTLSGIDHYEIKIDGVDLPVFTPEATSTLFTAPLLDSGKHNILIRAVDRAGNITEQSADFNIRPIEIPTITNYTKELEESQNLKVEGYSYSDSQITVSLRNKNKQVIEKTITTDDQGNFNLIWTDDLAAGTYEIYARVMDSRGAKSELTEPVVTVVNQRALFKIGALMLDYLGIGVIILITLAALIAFGWFLYFRLITMRRRIKMGISKTELLLHKSLTDLKEELHDHLELLENVKKSRSLTKEETTILRSLNRKIDAIEEDLDSSLKNIK